MLDALGRLHPLVVHFPIALLLVAAIVEVVRLRRSDHRPLRAGAIVALMGGLGAIGAAWLGWSGAEVRGGSDPTLETHRWLGVGAALWALVVGLAAAWAFAAPGRGSLARYRFTLIIGALVAGLAGHYGGALVHGPESTRTAIETLVKGAPPPAKAAAARGDFAQDVKPILAARCIGCHSGAGAQGGVRIDEGASLTRAGKSGRAPLVPGSPEQSEIIARVTSSDPKLRMPPKGAGLSAGEVSQLRAWIRKGGTTGAEGEGPWHWAYRAPRKENPPSVKRADWARNAIDAFVLAKLESAGLEPSPEAGELALLRRVSQDLTGLPPTREEIEGYLHDESPERYERAVERLLNSTAYAERMAAWWLDLARYADTHGYEKDARREIWPYRDWVIGAFAKDMPFDRFSTEQLAGDERADATLAQLVATGFNRNTMVNEEGGVDPEEFRVEAVHDRVRTFSSVWLGSTIACAQCHDHKHDPFTQRDYYRLFAYFNNDVPEVNYDGISSSAAGGTVGVPRAEDLAEFESLRARARAATGDELAALNERMRALTVASTMVMRRAESARESHIFEKGTFLAPGERVEAGTPHILHECKNEGATRAGLAAWLFDPRNPLTARVTANRIWEMHFGRGIVATSEDFGSQGSPPTHPELLDYLATELVRRGWSLRSLHRLIVTSATYRQSSAMLAGSPEKDPDNALLSRFPRVRLDAEFIRDGALVASGLLSPKVGGPSVFPPQPDGVWTMIYSSDQWTESTGEDRFRRALYTFWRRTAPYPTFAAFDAPSREIACTRRSRTNTPLQALATLNDPAFVEAAVALAAKMKEEGGQSPEGRIRAGFVRCLTREPAPEELARLRALYDAQAAAFGADPQAARALTGNGAPAGLGATEDPETAALCVVGNVLLNLDEAITRE